MGDVPGKSTGGQVILPGQPAEVSLDPPRRVWEAQQDQIPAQDQACLCKEKTIATLEGDWVPIVESDIGERTWSGMARFYWLGLTKNNELRSVHLQLRQKLRAITSDVEALHEQCMEKQ